MKLKVVPQSIVLILAIGCFITACNSKVLTKNTNNKNTQTLIDGAGDAQAYQEISGSMKRFKAMVAGSYVYYRTPTGKGDDYETWLVNDSNDSVLIYHIPIGNPNKTGHWLYHYQGLTSLIEDPLYEAFTELIPIGRDTIKAVSYKVPKNLGISISDVISNPRKVFNSVDFDNLEVDNEVITYARQNPIEYTGMLNFIPAERPEYGAFRRDSYIIYPHKMIWGISYYDKDYKHAVSHAPMWIVKLKHINFDLL